MIAYEVICAGIAGAVFGFTYSVIVKNLLNKKKSLSKSRLVATTIGLIGYLLITLSTNNQAVKTFVMSKFDKHYEFKNEMIKKMTPLLDNPIIKKNIAKLNSGDSVNDYIQNLTRKGLKRLSKKELIIWNDLRLKMAKNSNMICSGFWSGKIDSDELLSTLSSLSRSDLTAWINISQTAAIKELNNEVFQKVSPEIFNITIKKIAELQNRGDQQKMAIIISQGTNAKDIDGCWIIKTLLTGVSKIDKENRSTFLRYLASL